MNKYVYKYYRLSLDDENAVESNSITSQRQIVEHHLSTMSELADMPSKELVDDGFTGTNFDRPGVKQLLDAARRGEVGCIIVKDLSRFGRKHLEVGRYLEQLFPYLGIRFISIGDNYDSESHKGTTATLDIPVRNMLNELYSKDVSRKVKSAKQTQTRQGKYINAFAPYGYKKDPTNKHRIIIDEPAAEVVRRIFELTCADKGPKQIADIFNAEGILTPSNYKEKNGSKLKVSGITNSLWTNAIIVKILRDERYTGIFIGGKIEMGELGTGKRIHKPKDEWIRITNTHPAIITQDVWKNAISKRGKQTGQHGKPNTARMLYKRVRCGYCGRTMQYREDVKLNTYVCRTRFYTNEHGCTATRYSEEEIVSAVKTVVQSHISIMLDMDKLSATLRKASGQRASSTIKTVEELDREVLQLHASKRLLYEKYKKGLIDQTVYLTEREVLENSIRDKSVERETLTTKDNEQSEALNAANYFFDAFSQLHADKELSAEVVNALVDAVNVYGKGRIEIKFTFADKMEKALQALSESL